jgi:3-deoxy-D-manno-octulosonic-acid transferase
MKQIFIVFFYNFVILPVLYLAAHLAALFSRKMRHGIWVRHWQWKKIQRPKDKQVIIFHTASLGEYEHIRPLFPTLADKCAFPLYTVNMFFSPSGYFHAHREGGANAFIYAPFDTPWAVWRLYRRLRPRILIIAKHDVWPNQVWMARRMGIRVILINASLTPGSSRLRWWSAWFHRHLYRSVNRIFTISASDMRNYQRLVPNTKVSVAGDTKYDQVLVRRQSAEQLAVLPEKFWRQQQVIVLGSVWPADIEVIALVLQNVLEEESGVRLVLVPHEPDDKILALAREFFPDSCLYSEIAAYARQKTIIVDRIGVLATLYKYATLAFVGGGFREGVHNVMEAAVYGTPVLFGPHIGGTSEAEAMAKPGHGAHIVSNAAEFKTHVMRYLRNPERRQKSGLQAEAFVRKRLGASRSIANLICKYLKEGQRSHR